MYLSIPVNVVSFPLLGFFCCFLFIPLSPPFSFPLSPFLIPLVFFVFSFLFLSGDHPDIYRLNRYVQLHPRSDSSAVAAMSDLRRFPRWMWRNHAVREFVEWMREFNKKRQTEDRETRRREEEEQKDKTVKQFTPPRLLVGFYGLDLYSLFSSATAVLDYLKEHDVDAFKRAKKNYSTINQFQNEAGEYGVAVAYGL